MRPTLYERAKAVENMANGKSLTKREQEIIEQMRLSGELIEFKKGDEE